MTSCYFGEYCYAPPPPEELYHLYIYTEISSDTCLVFIDIPVWGIYNQVKIYITFVGVGIQQYNNKRSLGD